MAEPTILIRYGLVYVSWTTDREFSGNTVYLVSCDGNCNPPGDEGDLTSFQTAITYGTYIRLGTINSSGRLVPDGNNHANYAYAVATVNYVLEKNFYVIVVEEIPEENKYIVKAHGPSGNPVKATMDVADYGITLDKDGDGLLVTDDGDGLGITISRPVLAEQDTEAGRNIFDDASQFTYKLNIYRVPSGYDPATAIQPWVASKKYSFGDIVTMGETNYICISTVLVDNSLIPGTPIAEKTWKVYPDDKPMIYQSADGQTLIKTITLSDGTNDILAADTETLFIPNTQYKYVLTIYAEQRNGADKLVSEEYFCGVADGSTASCLKFDTTFTPGELCVVDLPENIANTQNAYGAESFGWTSFNRMGTGPEYLTVIAIQGDKSRIDDWMEQNCDQFACLAKTDIAETIPGYNATISGTLLLHLEESLNVDIEGVEVLANDQTYNGNAFGPDDLTYVNGTVDGDTITRTFVDAQGEPLAEQTATNAGTYKVKVIVHRDEYYNDYEETIDVVIGQAQSDFTILNSINPETYDGTTHDAETLVGKSSDGDFTDFTYTVTKDGETVSSISDAGEYLITVTASDSNGNYATKSKSVTFTINKAQLSGVSFDNDTVTYDGTEHSVTPSGTENGDTILYSLDGTTYDLTEAPSYTDVGTYMVYVKVIRNNYEDWIPANGAELTINKKTVQITPGSINVPSIPSNATSTTVNITGTVNVEGVATGDTVGFSTLQATYSSLSFGQQSVTIAAALNTASAANYSLDDSNLTGLTGVVYLVYDLKQNGNPSENGSNAHETTEIYIDFDADPGYSAAEVETKVAITGSYAERNLSGTVSTTTVTENGVTKYRWIIPITRTSTAGTGIDSINIKVTDDYIDPATKSYVTYLPTIYWGSYGLTETQYNNNYIPTMEQALAYTDGHVLTGGIGSYEVTFDTDFDGGYEGCAGYFIVRNDVGTITEIQDELGDPQNISGTDTPFKLYDNTNGAAHNGRYFLGAPRDSHLIYVIGNNSGNS